MTSRGDDGVVVSQLRVAEARIDHVNEELMASIDRVDEKLTASVA